jgi:hypothetical protein
MTTMASPTSARTSRRRRVEHAVRVDARAPGASRAGGHAEEMRPADSRGHGLGGRLAQRLRVCCTTPASTDGTARRCPRGRTSAARAGAAAGRSRRRGGASRAVVAQPPRAVGGNILDLQRETLLPPRYPRGGFPTRWVTSAHDAEGAAMFRGVRALPPEHLIGRGGMGEVHRAGTHGAGARSRSSGCPPRSRATRVPGPLPPRVGVGRAAVRAAHHPDPRLREINGSCSSTCAGRRHATSPRGQVGGPMAPRRASGSCARWRGRWTPRTRPAGAPRRQAVQRARARPRRGRVRPT